MIACRQHLRPFTRPLWKLDVSGQNMFACVWRNSEADGLCIGVVELDAVSEHLHVFNGTPYDGGLSELQTWDELQDFLRRRNEGAVQVSR